MSVSAGHCAAAPGESCCSMSPRRRLHRARPARPGSGPRGPSRRRRDPRAPPRAPPPSVAAPPPPPASPRRAGVRSSASSPAAAAASTSLPPRSPLPRAGASIRWPHDPAADELRPVLPRRTPRRPGSPAPRPFQLRQPRAPDPDPNPGG
nr:atherin-like [Aegilops tauschii subsp. strangulata]